MCYWLTIAAPSERALFPLARLGAQWHRADHPTLPPNQRLLQRFLVTARGCSCELFGTEQRAELGAALRATCALDGPILLHTTFGDAPNGSRAVAAPEPVAIDAFAESPTDWSDRWLRLTCEFDPDGPLPRSLDGAKVLAAAGLPGANQGAPRMLVQLERPHAPGISVVQCDAQWHILDERWFESAAAARRETSLQVPGIRWIDALTPDDEPRP